MAYQTSNPAGVKEILAGDSEWTYVDVRTVEEFEQAHVPGSYNITIFFMSSQGMQPNPGFADAVARAFEKQRKLVLGCKAGRRSDQACQLLEAQGFENLINMNGGFHGATDMSGRVLEPGWATCGFETTQECLPGRSWGELQG